MNEPKTLLAMIRQSVSIWFTSYGKILSKERELITPEPNIFQLRMAAAYEWCIANNRPVRIIALKPRRVGGTTMGVAMVMHHCRRWRSRAVTIADTREKSDILFSMVTTFGSEDRYGWGTTFEHDMEEARVIGTATGQAKRSETFSEIVKRSAEAPRGTRGDTLQVVHASEVAFWRDVGPHSADETAAALVNALAENPHTLGILESTANGARGLFYREWLRAQWPWWDGDPNLAGYWKTSSPSTTPVHSGTIGTRTLWRSPQKKPRSSRSPSPRASAAECSSTPGR